MLEAWGGSGEPGMAEDQARDPGRKGGWAVMIGGMKGSAAGRPEAIAILCPPDPTVKKKVAGPFRKQALHDKTSALAALARMSNRSKRSSISCK
jgi:hypothetical protein